jgi:hypothetical protein
MKKPTVKLSEFFPFPSALLPYYFLNLFCLTLQLVEFGDPLLKIEVRSSLLNPYKIEQHVLNNDSSQRVYAKVN